MIYSPGDVIMVAFPYSDRSKTKWRPAVVISEAESYQTHTGQIVAAMITSARHSVWPFDMAIEDFHSAGLTRPSIIRMKIFTLDARLIATKQGDLAAGDLSALRKTLHQLLLPGG